MPKLSRKMISTISQGSGFTEYLTFTTGDIRCALEIMRLREVIEYQEITPVPGMPEFLPGLINVRWDMIPVIDMMQILLSGSSQSRSCSGSHKKTARENTKNGEIHDSHTVNSSGTSRDEHENPQPGDIAYGTRASVSREEIAGEKKADCGNWLIVTNASMGKEHMQVGILADQVDDVIQLGNDEISPPHELGARIHPRFLQGIGDVENLCLFIIDINAIVSFVHELVKERRE